MKNILDIRNEKSRKRLKLAAKTALSIFVVICTAVACRYVWNVIQTTPFHEIREALIAIPPVRLLVAILLVAVAYFVMTGYDTLGMRMAGSRLPYRKIAFVSFIGDSINANMALCALVGSAVKLRLYMARGESVSAVARAIASYTVAYWGGFSLLFSLSAMASFFIGRRYGSAPLPSAYAVLAIAASIVTILYFTACLNGRVRKKIPAFFPRGAIGLKLLAVGFADWCCSALVFFLLLPVAEYARFPEFVNLYLYSHALGMVSQAPGGLGVFESVCLLMGRDISSGPMLATLFTFRLIYFILPLCTALTLLGFSKAIHLFTRSGSERLRGNKQTHSHMTQPAALPFVTVVVPAYNEERFLPSCLAALSAQQYAGRREIIVVDNASTDNTAAVAAAYGCRVVHEPVKGYNRAIAAGFNAAKGDIIACTDADTIVPVNWLSSIVEKLSQKNAVACGGVFTFHDGSPWIKLLGYLFGRFNYHIAGANMAVWKHAYLRCGGFSSDINLGADVEIGKRLKKIGKVVIDRSMVVSTSSRRFASAFWKTVTMYYVNDFCLLFLNRPLFRAFRDYRTLQPAGLPGRGMLFAAMTLFMVFFTGWITEPPLNWMSGSMSAKAAGLKTVALTFDDGPGKSTEKILDILESYGVKATFFVIGKNAEQYPHLLKRMAAQGHEIGNHSYSHSLKVSIESPRALKKELDLATATIHSITGKPPVLFRAPHGWSTPWMIRECSALGYHHVVWTVDALDWLHISHERIVENVLRKTKPGSIILLHDRLNTAKNKEMSNTVDALPVIIKTLLHEGFIFVTISELQAMAPELVQRIPSASDLTAKEY